MNNLPKFNDNYFITLKDKLWLKRQQHAGRCVASCLRNCGDAIKSESKLNVLDLVKICERQFNIWECEPTFFNYKGSSPTPFPGKICVSINEEVVHGVPKDRELKSGDVISIDLGATFEGAIADAARTFIFGDPISSEHVRLLETCKDALKNGIKAIAVGKQLGCIGHAIYNSTKNSGFGLITQYCGHGISYNQPHANPYVYNKDLPDNGVRITNGLSIAIEPQMLLSQDTSTKILNDNWTVVSKSGKVGVHFEDSVTIMDDLVYNITEVLYE